MNNHFLVIGLFLIFGLFLIESSNSSTQNIKQTDYGIIIRLQDGDLKLRVCNERIIRVLYDPTTIFKRVESLVVIKHWQPAQFEVQDRRTYVEVRTQKVIVRVDLQSGAVSFYNMKGDTLFQENDIQPRVMTPAHVMGEDTYHAQLNMKFSKNEAVYGLGQHQNGVMNYREHEVVLTQENTKVAIPFLTSTKNYGILLDNYSKIIFHDKNDSSYFWLEVADLIDYYLIAGSDMDDVIQGYREATGQAPLFGKWAYGYWQSKERYKTKRELLGIAKEYRERKISIDNIIQDWQYWGEDWAFWSSMQFDSTRYPNPQEMIRQLHNDYHIHLMVSIWPVLGSATKIGNELQSKGLLYKPFHWTDGHTYDAYSQEARQIYWRYLNKGLFSKGVDAFWMDATEPEVFVAPHEQSIKSAKRNVLGTMVRYLNPYSLMATTCVYEGQRSVTSDKRVFVLTRSAFLGQQRNAAATWSGDIVADWKVFLNQISAGLNFCMSGIPYWSNDIGGFHIRRYGAFFDGCKDPGYRELYVRWFQYGAFNPIFRAHGTDTPREIWRFGKPGSWAYDALVKYLNLRYRLLPYIYSLAWKVTSDGYTMMRGLAIDFAHDKNVHNIDDQFMFGPALLINPVTDHTYYGEDYYNELIPAEQLFTENGQQGGFTAQYFNGVNFDTLMVDSVQTELLFDLYLGKDLPEIVRWDKNSKRWSGWIKTEAVGEYEFWITSDDAVRFWLDEKLLVDNWNDQRQDKTHRIKSELEANRRYHFRLEQARMADATKLRLGWCTPEMKVDKHDPDKEVATRKLYLPKSSDWYDFWTGEKLIGGRIINRKVPIDIMPIYVRAGSIIPKGPQLQYADEKPADPTELRVYTGADCQFELYEDEGDNYNYEQGVYTIIPIQWDDKIEKLTIGERKGSFPGMLKERTFHVVWVSGNHGIGEVEKRPDVVVVYEGKAVKVKK